MTLHLEPVDDAAAAPAPEGRAHAVLVDTDGRVLRLFPQDDGGLVLALETGRGIQPRALDRFQTSALRAAVMALPDG
jgi:hypothetical protein